MCTQASGAAAPYTGSTNDPVRGGRISKVDASGHVTTVVGALPSSQTAPALGGLVTGVTSVAFIGHRLYGLLGGAGCSHGVPMVPNGVFRVHRNGSWSLIADLSAFIQANPVANPDEEDFEPDGTWYSMISIDGALYPMDSNHGELDRVTPDGSISRVIDISAVVGHVVPTALAVRRHLLVANLGLFEPTDGAGDEHVYRLTRPAPSRMSPPESRRSSDSPSAGTASMRWRRARSPASRPRPPAPSCGSGATGLLRPSCRGSPSRPG
jgi:hypothetical protein